MSELGVRYSDTGGTHTNKIQLLPFEKSHSAAIFTVYTQTDSHGVPFHEPTICAKNFF